MQTFSRKEKTECKKTKTNCIDWQRVWLNLQEFVTRRPAVIRCRHKEKLRKLQIFRSICYFPGFPGTLWCLTSLQFCSVGFFQLKNPLLPQRSCIEWTKHARETWGITPASLKGRLWFTGLWDDLRALLDKKDTDLPVYRWRSPPQIRHGFTLPLDTF